MLFRMLERALYGTGALHHLQHPLEWPLIHHQNAVRGLVQIRIINWSNDFAMARSGLARR